MKTEKTALDLIRRVMKSENMGLRFYILAAMASIGGPIEEDLILSKEFINNLKKIINKIGPIKKNIAQFFEGASPYKEAIEFLNKLQETIQ